MGGFFGVASSEECVADLFYGTDYHSHLGTVRGGMVVKNSEGFTRFIHDITNAQFRSKFEDNLPKMHGNTGIGVISDCDDQPLIIGSHMGTYAIVTVGKIDNAQALVESTFRTRSSHFTVMDQGEINQTEIVATLINREENFVAGIRKVQETIEGSCSLLLLTDDGIYAARDRFGRTPIVVGRGKNGYAVSMETCALPNLEYEEDRILGPGEIVRVTDQGIEQVKPAEDRLQICSFLWVYYGYPASNYEGINTEATRNRCGAALARKDNVEVDMVAGIPDSGTGHAIGYANESGVPYMRPFVKYTPTWPRSFMPQDQRVRDVVARMKLIPILDLMRGKRMLFCEDSIVRGTQLREQVQRLFEEGAEEVHMRPACPPLLFGCKFLNFSRSRSVMDLAGRKAIEVLEGEGSKDLDEYACTGSDKQCAMIEQIRKDLHLTTLRYQELPDLVDAIGLPKEKLCTYCWDAAE